MNIDDWMDTPSGAMAAAVALGGACILLREIAAALDAKQRASQEDISK